MSAQREGTPFAPPGGSEGVCLGARREGAQAIALASPTHWARELLARERTLAIFGALMLLAMVPALLALGLDDRSLRGVNVWVKPLKFMAALALFSFTTAWFVGLIRPAERSSRLVRAIVGIVVATGTLEVGYITLQAALGQASHYNFSSPLSIALYSAMGLAALLLTTTQAMLAWAVARHGRDDLHPTWRLAVVLGLAMTFLLGAGAGGALGSMQPPAGTGLPWVGWHLAGGDLRPAHFLGLHAHQLIPLAGLGLMAWMPARSRVALVLLALAYTALWALAMQRGLDGAVLTVPLTR
jgi:hypothetical protein